MPLSPEAELRQRLVNHLAFIYPEEDGEALMERLIQAMKLDDELVRPRWTRSHWSERDVALITYANSIVSEDEKPLQTLERFFRRHLSRHISWVHILPFFPFSSDDGFAVIDYTRVNDSFGDWDDIERIAGRSRLMADLVINHCSGMSRWFEQFREGRAPGRDYFVTGDPDRDTSAVVRPRTSPLFREVQTPDGIRHVWCTFSHDQPDLDFANPEVLLEMIKIIRYYIDRGVRIFRLDAVAFLWKEPGTSCLNLDQTHEIVRLIRTLTEFCPGDICIITETNIPNMENLSYFGNANEAHMVYNFSLPPLLLNTLVTGNCHGLKSWLMSMPPAQAGTTFFNFIASHDGIGLRPLEGLLTDEELGHLIGAMENNGGRVSWRTLPEGQTRPYEINITLFDALRGTLDNPEDGWQEARFILAHTIMLALEGLPAFYIHSLLSTENDHEKFANTNNNRAINRHNWDVAQLESLLGDDNHHSRLLQELTRRIGIRKRQKAFHPNAIMFTLHLGDEVFAFWRQSRRRHQSIFCLNNITDREQEIPRSSLNLIASDTWTDLLSGTVIEETQQVLTLAPYQSLWLSNV